jgi:2-polyprenyl-3-methyl-5-hydroxy-6-metoxy-1,4-benzoquinol methylase
MAVPCSSYSTINVTDADRRHWEARYTSGRAPVHANANRWLVTQAAYVDALQAAAAPAPQALDIACGVGGTLLWLAQRGWLVTGVDISETALALARSQLESAGLVAHAALIAADLDAWRPAAASYDLVTCFYFLDRRLWPALRAAVRPGGLLCLSTYHTGRLAERPDTNPKHLLEPGELAALAESWGWRLLAAQTGAQLEAILAQRRA